MIIRRHSLIVLGALLTLATFATSCRVGPLRIGPPAPTPTESIAIPNTFVPVGSPLAHSTKPTMPAASPTIATAKGSEAPTPSTVPRATATVRSAATTTATVPPARPSPTAPALRGQPQWTLSELNQGDKKQIILEDGTSSFTVATVDAADSFERWGLAFAADLTGDGVLEAVVFHYTGGAHCCSEYLIFGSDPNGIRRYDAFGLGNDGLAPQGVKDLDGDGIPELQTGDDRFAYFADVPYAVSPRLPMVLCRTAQGTYQDCTPKFPQIMVDYAKQEERHLGDAVKQGATSDNKVEQHGAALAVLVAYMRVGQEDQGWSRVKAICPDCETWLRANLADIQVVLRQKRPLPYSESHP